MGTMIDNGIDCATAGTDRATADTTTSDTPKASDTDTATPGSATDGRDSGTASFTTTDTASGTNSNVGGTLTISATPSSASLSGSFASSSDGAGADTADPGGSGTATFTFTDTASGTNPRVSGTLSIGTTPTSASLSGSFASSSDDPMTAGTDAPSFADTAKAIASGNGDPSLLNDLSSSVTGPASGSGTDAGGQGSPVPQPTGQGCPIGGAHEGQRRDTMTAAPHHQFSA